MSVIFQALQQLDTGEVREPASGEGAACPQDQAAKPRLLLRCVLIAAAAGFLVVLGMGAVQGVRLLASQVQQAPAAEGAPLRHPLPVERPTPQEDNVRPTSTGPGEPPGQVRYLPPAPDQGASGRSAALVENPPAGLRAPAPAALDHTSPDQADAAAPVSSSKNTLPEQSPESRRSHDSDAREAAPNHEKSRLSVADETNKKVWKQAQARRQAVLEKQARINRLVGRIERAIQTSAQTDAMMAELSRLKGADSDYVMKLKAFQLMKSGDHDRAEALLKRVLSANETDLEAGFNLAVIEVRTGRNVRAVSRLKQLRNLYPGDERIEDLLRKIKGT
ncbi:MAG: tetratricopeptide repeat protein [Desulfosarcinaceae bacterium]